MFTQQRKAIHAYIKRLDKKESEIVYLQKLERRRLAEEVCGKEFITVCISYQNCLKGNY